MRWVEDAGCTTSNQETGRKNQSFGTIPYEDRWLSKRPHQEAIIRKCFELPDPEVREMKPQREGQSVEPPNRESPRRHRTYRCFFR
jgi:hypothetical protein